MSLSRFEYATSVLDEEEDNAELSEEEDKRPSKKKSKDNRTNFNSLEEWYSQEFCTERKDGLHEILQRHFPLKDMEEKLKTMRTASKGALRQFVLQHYLPGFSFSSWAKGEVSKFLEKSEIEKLKFKSSVKTLALFHFFYELNVYPPSKKRPKNMYYMFLFKYVQDGGSIFQYISTLYRERHQSSNTARENTEAQNDHADTFSLSKENLSVQDDEEDDTIASQARIRQASSTSSVRESPNTIDVGSMDSESESEFRDSDLVALGVPEPRSEQLSLDISLNSHGKRLRVDQASDEPREEDFGGRTELKKRMLEWQRETAEKIQELVQWKEESERQGDEDKKKMKSLQEKLALTRSELERQTAEFKSAKERNQKLSKELEDARHLLGSLKQKIEENLSAMNPRLDTIFRLINNRF